MYLEFEDQECSISFPKVPNPEEDVTAYITAFGTEWATSACKQRAQTSIRTATNARFKAGMTAEQVQEWANSHTPGRGGPRKSATDKQMTQIDKLTADEQAALFEKLSERFEEAAD